MDELSSPNHSSLEIKLLEPFIYIKSVLRSARVEVECIDMISAVLENYGPAILVEDENAPETDRSQRKIVLVSRPHRFMSCPRRWIGPLQVSMTRG